MFAFISVVITALAGVAGLLTILNASTIATEQIAFAARAAAPIVSQVNPVAAPNNLDSPLVVSGTNFSAILSGTQVITAPHMFLGDHSLSNVHWVATTTLTATIPWGMEAGVYTLTVVNPDGESGFLANAFTVTHAVNVWTAEGPFGGSVMDLAVNPVQTQTVFAVVHFAGLYQSHDGGQHWEHTTLGPGDRFAHVSYGSASPNTLFVCGSIGLLASSDDGLTWQPLDSGEVMAFAQHPTDPDILYISRWDEGILRTDDGGQQWENRSQGIDLLRVRSILIDPTTPTTLYATTDGTHLYKSTDEGLHWELADAGVVNSPDVKLTLAINPFDTHNLWLLGTELYHSINGAQDWVTVPITYEIPWALAFDPILSGTLYAGSAHDLLVSNDGGDHWERFSQTSFDGMIDHIRLDPSSGKPIYLGNNGSGFYRSPDQGATWEQAVEGMSGVEPRAIAPASSKADYVYVMSVDGIFYSDRAGQSWVKTIGGEKVKVAVDPSDYRTAYSAQWGPGSIAKTSDGGLHWSPIVVSNDPDRYVSAITIYPTNTRTILVGGGSQWGEFALSAGWLARSQDGGDSWQELTLGHVISEVTSIVVHPILTNTLYIGTCTIHPYWNHGSLSGVYKSSDGGTTWSPANEGLNDRCVRHLVMHPENPEVLFAAINDPAPGAIGIYRSEDGGAHWAASALGLDNNTVLELAFDPLSPSHLYAATWQGLFYSSDVGQSWQRAAGPLGMVPVFSVAAASLEDRTFLYAGTIGGSTASQNGSQFGPRSNGAVEPGVYQMTIHYQNLYLPLVLR